MQATNKQATSVLYINSTRQFFRYPIKFKIIFCLLYLSITVVAVAVDNFFSNKNQSIKIPEKSSLSPVVFGCHAHF